MVATELVGRGPVVLAPSRHQTGSGVVLGIGWAGRISRSRGIDPPDPSGRKSRFGQPEMRSCHRPFNTYQALTARQLSTSSNSNGLQIQGEAAEERRSSPPEGALSVSSSVDVSDATSWWLPIGKMNFSLSRKLAKIGKERKAAK